MEYEQFDQRARVTIADARHDVALNIVATDADKKNRAFRLVFDIDGGDKYVAAPVNSFVKPEPSVDLDMLKKAKRMLKPVRKNFDGIGQKLLRFITRKPKEAVISDIEIDNSKGATVAIVTITVAPKANYDQVYDRVYALLGTPKSAEIYSFDERERMPAKEPAPQPEQSADKDKTPTTRAAADILDNYTRRRPDSGRFL